MMESNVLKYIVKTLVVVAILALIIIGVRRCKSAEDKLEGYENNWIALSNENNKNAKSSKLYEFKLSQLKYINDSLMNAMDSVRKSLNIKDKNLKGLGYIKSTVRIHDTVLVNRIRDGDKTLSIDTVINKKWYQIEIDYKGSSDLTFLGKQINANLLSGFVYKGDAFNADSDTFKSQYPTDGAVTGNIFIPYFKII